MADEQNANGDGQEQKNNASDSGLGNLPPLSDFDSQASGAGASSDPGLPPLGGFDTDAGSADSLPPLSDIEVEVPEPAGGNIKQPPPGFESSDDAFSSGAGLLDTPAENTGFQDLAADSDFSPETPEIGPGPGSDSGLDTPMFDSAFGGGNAAGGFGGADDLATPAPTQAMETPMFGVDQAPGGGDAGMVGGDGGGFDQGAFSGIEGMGETDFNAGTPAPDFSPDTDIQEAAAGAKKKKAKKKGGGGGGSKAAPVLLVAGLIIGIVVGPMASSYIPMFPAALNPAGAKLADAEKEIIDLNESLAEYRKNKPGDFGGITKEAFRKLESDIIKATEDLNDTTAQLKETTAKSETARAALDAVEGDLAQRNEEFVTLSENYEDLKQESAIIQARQRGLIAEVERLNSYVGGLEDANVRRVSTKEALSHNVERLLIQVKEGMPLTPDKYSHAKRLAAVEDLQDKVSNAKWVTPALQEAYTNLYLNELKIASAKEYFYAKLPVTDEFGNTTNKWAECLMLGTWSVRYRSLDGKNIGEYTNVSTQEAPVWDFVEELPGAVKREIESEVIASRVEGFEDKVRYLAEKTLASEESTAFQRTYSSL